VVQAAARRVREREIPVATAHLRHLDPLPRNTGEVVRAFPKVLIPEVNTGQLLGMIRGRFLVDAVGYNKMEGLPIFAEELEGAILEVLA
jgi:2-oxoglutarate ferredoxin oxidoreductase subunit alpha